jgi:hypothetical protein
MTPMTRQFQLLRQSEVKPKNLRKNDVASVARSLDGKIVSIVVTGESVTGEISSVSTDGDGNTVATISGTEYKVDLNAKEDCKSGTEGVFYTDLFDRIGYVESSSSGKLSSTEKYGWVMTTYSSDDGEDTMIKMYTQDGKAESFKMASSMTYWPANADEAHKATKAEIIELGKDSSKFMTGGGYSVRLAKYKLNSKNEITQLYLASEKTSDNVNSDGVVVDKNNMRGKSAAGSFISEYLLEDGGVQFTVPSSTADMANASNYSVSTVTASQYLNVEGVQIDFLLGEFKDSRYPKVLIRYSSSGGTSVSPISDYGTANDNPTMLISNIGYGKNEDDEYVYTIKGYSGGALVSYTTCSTTGVYYLDPTFTDFASSKDAYKGTKIFDATKDDISKFNSALKIGDVIGIQASGSTADVIIKMVDYEDLVADLNLGEDDTKTQWTGTGAFSATRDSITVGEVTAAELEGVAFLTAGGASVSFDSSKVLDALLVTVDSDGKIVQAKVDKEGGYDIVDLQNGLDDDSITDYAFIRQFKGGMREISIIRVQQAQ